MPELTREQFQRVEELFHQLCELDDDAHALQLAQLENEDPAVLEEVQRLLQDQTAHDQALAGFELLVRGTQSTRDGTLVGSGERATLSPTESPEAAAETGTDRSSNPSDSEDRVLGAYRLTRRLGRGGMGEVWIAEQTEPIEREVAIKLIGSDRHSRASTHRFLAERQALAAMDHPYIARVYDAGQTERGVPYLVMELVQDATSLTDYCASAELSLRQRLDLMAKVCDAIEHAHRKRIIHRDLKPSNILVSDVDGQPVPKVIDFGIAKPIESDLNAAVDLTRRGDLLGTPRYMSPEQASLGKIDIDTRSDVYTLCLLLYELLVGDLPLSNEQARDLPFDELLRRVREEEPARASTRLRQLATRTSPSTQGDRSSAGDTSAATLGAPPPTNTGRRTTTSPATNWRTLRGDLDRIVGKALATDRERRYGSAAELGDDLRRYLRNEPVLATEPSLAYQGAKFFRRHRFAVSLGLLGLAGVIAALLGTSFGLVRARAAELEAVQAQQVARTEARTAERVAEFLEQLLQDANPERTQGTSVRDLLDRGEEKLRTELRDEPEIRARLLLTVGTALRASGDYPRAEALFEEAQELSAQVHGAESAAVERVLSARSDLLQYSGKLELAFEVAEQQLALANRIYPAGAIALSDPLLQVGMAHWRLGRFDEAFALLQDSLAILRQHAASSGPEKAEPLDPTDDLAAQARRQLPRVLNNVAILHWQLGRMPKAIEAYQEALDIQRDRFGDDHPHVASTLHNLALAHRSQRNFELALEQNLEALRIRRIAFEEPHPDIAESLNNLGLVYHDLADNAAAAENIRAALNMRRLLLEEPNDLIATSEYNLGITLRESDPDAARRAMTNALEAFRATLGPEHFNLSVVLHDLARLEGIQGNHDLAVQHARDAKAIVEQALPPDNPLQQKANRILWRRLDAQGKPATLAEREQLRVAFDDEQ